MRGADQHGTHLLADRSQRAGQDLKLDRIDHRSRSRQRLPASSTRPLQPPGTSSVASGSSTIDGPGELRARCRGPAEHVENQLASPEHGGATAATERLRGVRIQRHLAPGKGSGDPDRDQLQRAVGVPVAVSLLVRRLEGRPERPRIRREVGFDRKLERLTLVAQLVGGLEPQARVRPSTLAARRPRALPRSRLSASAVSRSPTRSTLRWTSRRRWDTTSPSAASTPEARGQMSLVIPSSSAMAAACSGPAPPKASSACVRGSIPRCTVTTLSAPTISALATRMIPSAQAIGSSPSSAAS